MRLRMFKTGAAILATCVVCCVVSGASAGFGTASSAFGKSYFSNVTYEMQRAAPKWSGNSAHPPISAREALHLANRQVSRLVREQESWRRHLFSLTLLPLGNDDWLWIAKYEWYPKKIKKPFGQWHDFDVLILMDGSVVEPEVSDDPSPTFGIDFDHPVMDFDFPVLDFVESQTFGKSYLVHLNDSGIPYGRSPAWREDSDHPPLTAREALAVADDFAKRVSATPDGLVRRLSGISLRSRELADTTTRWLWVVKYEWLPSVGGGSGIPHNLQVVVLMDGSIVEPYVR